LCLMAHQAQRIVDLPSALHRGLIHLHSELHRGFIHLLSALHRGFVDPLTRLEGYGDEKDFEKAGFHSGKLLGGSSLLQLLSITSSAAILKHSSISP